MSDQRREWLRFENDIIKHLFERIEQWLLDGRKPPQTYFTAGLERQVALMIERAINRDGWEKCGGGHREGSCFSCGLRAQIKELRDALRPLAAMMESVTPTFMGYEDGHHDAEPVNGFEPRITVGDVRRAAKLVG